VIELYAITDDPAPPDPPLVAVRADGLTALCAPAERREVTADVLWRHEEVVEGLMRDRDLLPVRFGTLVEDERAAARALEERREELATSLDHVRGAVELAVRAHRREGHDPPPAVSGAEYMQAKARLTEAARLLHEPLAFLARDSVVRPGPELLRAAYLVDREAVDGFVDLVKRLEATHDDLHVLCTGPWPPYSFTGT
jgi:beta-phosphoglucomutase-like phosphatase (HAD superfamily)